MLTIELIGLWFTISLGAGLFLGRIVRGCSRPTPRRHRRLAGLVSWYPTR